MSSKTATGTVKDARLVLSLVSLVLSKDESTRGFTASRGGVDLPLATFLESEALLLFVAEAAAAAALRKSDMSPEPLSHMTLRVAKTSE